MSTRLVFHVKTPGASEEAMDMAWLTLCSMGTTRMRNGNEEVRLINVERIVLVDAGVPIES